MAQGRPPRRSSKKRDPVTIDSKADKAAAPTASESETGPGAGVTKDEKSQPVPSSQPSSKSPETQKAQSGPGKAASARKEEAGKPYGPPEQAPEEPAATEKRTSGKDAPEEKTTAGGKSVPPTPAAGQDRTQARTHSQAPRAPRSSAFMAGLVGAVIAVVVLVALEWSGVLPVPGGDEELQSTLDSLRSDLGSVRQTVTDVKSAQQDSANDSGLSDLANRVQELSARVDAVEKSASRSGDAASQSDVTALKDQLGSANEQMTALGDRVDKLDSRISGLRDQTRIARSVAASGLKTAIDRGGDFSAELSAYESLAPDDAVVGKLEDLASSGVPSQDELLDAFPDAANAILAAARTDGGGSDGVFGRLMSSARSVVTVRPTGDSQGTGPADIVARMENRLRRGNLQAVVDEWSSLPDASKEASQAFIDDVKARLRAQSLAEKTLSGAAAAKDDKG